MKKLRKFNRLIIVFIFIIQNLNSQDLLLKGKLDGFEENTKIIINPCRDNMEFDTDDETVISLREGEFEFTRHLYKPTKFSIRVRPANKDNIQEYEGLTFWAENTSMTLNGKKGHVFESDVKGSEIQNQYFEYTSSIARLQSIIKQIADSVRTMPGISEEKKAEMRVRYHSAQASIDKIGIDFFYSHPQYYCTAPELVFLITFIPDQVQQNRLSKFYGELPPVFQSNVYGRQIKSFIDKNNIKLPALKVGDYPFYFSLKDTASNEIKFSSIKSKVILLDFWGSGCGPCRTENKNYVKLYEDFKDSGFEIVSVSIDQSRKMLSKAIKDDKVTWISLWDEKREVYRNIYQVKALPTSYLIVEGKIMAINLRGEELRKAVENVINETKK
jgi:peroxiredoxin